LLQLSPFAADAQSIGGLHSINRNHSFVMADADMHEVFDAARTR
jgi:hypothetical protein